MSIQLLFWILMLLWLVLWGAFTRPLLSWGGGLSVLLFALILILGWKIFGAPLHN